MADVRRDLRFRFIGDAASLNKAAQSAERSMTTVQDKMSAVGRKLEGVGNTLTLGVTAPLVAFGTSAVRTAISVEESMSKVGVVFGIAGDEVTAWSENLVEGFQIGQATALEAAGVFGTFFTDLPDEEAADMSMRLVELAADLASFNNIPIEEALTKLQAGLAGESEPLRRLGVFMNAAAVEAKALELGLVGTGEELDDQAKLIARYNLILQETQDAQGDAARTADTTAGQLRTAAAEWENLRAQFGEIILPIAQTGVEALSDLLGFFNELDPSTQERIVQIGVGLAALGPAVRVLGFALQHPGIVAMVAAGGILAYLYGSGRGNLDNDINSLKNIANLTVDLADRVLGPLADFDTPFPDASRTGFGDLNRGGNPFPREGIVGFLRNAAPGQLDYTTGRDRDGSGWVTGAPRVTVNVGGSVIGLDRLEEAVAEAVRRATNQRIGSTNLVSGTYRHEPR